MKHSMSTALKCPP